MKNFFKKAFLNKIIRRFTAAATASALLFTNAAAADSILGVQTSHTETEYAQRTVYNRNTFESDSVGQQTENYFSYIPNPDVLPIISNGSSVYGKRTVLETNDFLNSSGIFAAMGMNADFFSFTTGVPMSNTIVDGEVLTCDTDTLIALGFNADGTAFITPMNIEISVTRENGAGFGIEALNKFRQPYIMYLYTDDFGDYTSCSGWGTNIVLGDVSGEFALNRSVTATVESVTEADGSVEIPDGKLVLSVDSGAADQVKSRLNGITLGEKLTITARETTGDTRWQNAVYGTGCLGGSLIRNGQLDFEDDIAAPRSAVGIKADGSIIFYTIDGRQQGYSYGVRKETLANRLLELGCVDAVNLDGGGSTQLAGTLPETTEMKVLNQPSESLRRCANFIFLKKTNAPSGIPYKLLTYPYGEYLLSGSSVGIWVSAIDSSYGKATITEPVTYAVTSGDGEITADGRATVRGDGDVYISTSSGAAQGSTMLHSVTTPDRIVIKSEDSGAELAEIALLPGETINLTADSEYSGMALTDKDEAYSWSVSDPAVGAVSENGTFTAADVPAEGSITVRAGGSSASIRVRVSLENAPPPQESDYPSINGSLENGTLTAYITGYHGELKSSDITLKYDGKKISSFDYAPERSEIKFAIPEGFETEPHLISISVTDEAGFSALKVFAAGAGSAVNIYADTENHWAKDYISYMTGRNVVSGYYEDGASLFKPDNNMTRAEFACMISNYLGINPYNYRGVELPYSDLSAIPDWAIMQVQALYSLGIMTGQQNGERLEFSPSGKIKRCEFSVAAARLLPAGLFRGTINAADSADVPDWAKDETALLLNHGIMNGYTDGALRPNNNVTRAEAIKILYNIG